MLNQLNLTSHCNFRGNFNQKDKEEVIIFLQSFSLHCFSHFIKSCKHMNGKGLKAFSNLISQHFDVLAEVNMNFYW